MKKSVCLIIILLLIFFCILCLIPVKPVVIIQNKTNDNLYVQASESVFGIEPVPEEVDKIIKNRPSIIAPGRQLRLTASFFSIISESYEFNIGWLIGGRYSYNATSGGGQNFTFSTKTGSCLTRLIINPGYNNSELINEAGAICLKKLSPLKLQY